MSSSVSMDLSIGGQVERRRCIDILSKLFKRCRMRFKVSMGFESGMFVKLFEHDDEDDDDDAWKNAETVEGNWCSVGKRRV